MGIPSHAYSFGNWWFISGTTNGLPATAARESVMRRSEFVLVPSRSPNVADSIDKLFKYTRRNSRVRDTRVVYIQARAATA